MVWRNGVEGKHSTLFTAPLFEEKFRNLVNGDARDWRRVSKGGDISASPHYFHNTDANGTVEATKFVDLARLPLQPLPPLSTAPSPTATFVTVSFSGAEVGTGEGRGVIAALSKLLGATQSDLNSAITKAAKKVIEPEEPTPPAKPEFYCGTFTGTPTGGTVQWTKSDTVCPATPAT